jgi:hypothetical protein
MPAPCVNVAYEPRTELGWRYAVLPDEEYDRHRWRGELARQAVRRADARPSLPPWPSLTGEPANADSPFDALRVALAQRMKGELAARWSELLAIETVVNEVVEIFQDEVVIPSSMRALLSGARSELLRLHKEGSGLLELGPLPDADQEFVELLHKGLQRDERLYL